MNRSFRLSKRTDFERVRRTGKSYAHPLIVLVSLSNNLPTNRYGVSAGRSVGGAVQRNRAKRRIRAILNSLEQQITPGHDLVFLARSSIHTGSPQDLEKAVLNLLRRAKLLRKTS